MEEWKDIKGYEGRYQISSEGRVKSLNYQNTGKEKVLKPRYTKRGYGQVILNGKYFAIHRLVAKTFLPNPNNYPIVNHKDENPSNNTIENLEWCDIKYNINYGTANKRRGNSLGYDKDNPYSKSVLQYTKDGTLIRKWDSQAEAARQLGVSQGNISSCCMGIRCTAYGYIWKYAA